MSPRPDEPTPEEFTDICGIELTMPAQDKQGFWVRELRLHFGGRPAEVFILRADKDVGREALRVKSLVV